MRFQRRPRSLRIGIEHPDAGPAQVGPILDLLGITRPVADDHHAVGQNASIGPGIPIRPDLGFLDQDLHIALVRQDRQIGVETRGDLAGLGT